MENHRPKLPSVENNHERCETLSLLLSAIYIHMSYVHVVYMYRLYYMNSCIHILYTHILTVPYLISVSMKHHELNRSPSPSGYEKLGPPNDLLSCLTYHLLTEVSHMRMDFLLKKIRSFFGSGKGFGPKNGRQRQKS